MLLINRVLALVALASVLAASGHVQAQVPGQSLTGQWRITNGVMHGNPVPAAVLSAMSLNFTDSTFTATSQSVVSSGSFTVNTTVTPNQATFVIGQGSDNGRELKAIYQFTGTNLLITFSETAQFPSGFQSTPANRLLSLTYSQGAAGAGTATSGVAGGQPPAPGQAAAGTAGTGLGGPDD